VQAQHDESLDKDEQILDTSFPGFFRLDELAFPYPSTLVAHADKQPEAKMKVVARTSPKSRVAEGSRVNMKFLRPLEEWELSGDYGSRAMAIALDGTIKSAFADSKAPEQDDKSEKKDDQDKGVAGKSAPARVLVISAPQFLTNPLARAGNPPPMPPQMAMMGSFGGDEDLQMLAGFYARNYLTGTILAFKNMLDWMAGDTDLLAASAKLLSDPNLTYSDIEKPDIDPTQDTEKGAAEKWDSYKKERKNRQLVVQWSLTVFPPLLFAAIGLIRWRRRESNRGRISLD
jgi:hypothetical protein